MKFNHNTYKMDRSVDVAIYYLFKTNGIHMSNFILFSFSVPNCTRRTLVSIKQIYKKLQTNLLGNSKCSTQSLV